jgi:Family of unknown function (DUF5995)
MADFREIASQRPADIDEALRCMRTALDWFHERDDFRAVFLRAYHLITSNVSAAVHQRGDFAGKQIFFDSDWVQRLSGTFATLYFQSLTTSERGEDSERAWKIAHRTAEARSGTIVQDLLLGLNAHINYDLAYAIYLNLKEHGDGADHLLLPRRKFDHDQVNNILVRSIPEVAEVLTRDYGGGILFLTRVMLSLDDILSSAGLKYFRERVWWTAISYLATNDDEEVDLVHERLNWESGMVAKGIVDESLWSLPLRAVGCAVRKRHFSDIDLDVAAEPQLLRAVRVPSPF